MSDAVQPPRRSRILVVDDHAFFRDGIAAWLDRQEGLSCCGHADTAEAVADAASRLQPDLILLDLTLRASDGFSVLKLLSGMKPRPLVLVLSRRDEVLFAERALRAGARGYVMKDEPAETVLAAIRSVLRGGTYITPRLSRHLLDRSAQPGTAALRGMNSLSSRELEVFELLGSGLTSKAIAGRLGISVKTVDFHREQLKEKLGLPDGVALLQHATLWVQRDRESS